IENYSDSQLKEHGWICLRNRSHNTEDLEPTSERPPFGFWVEGRRPYAFTHESNATDHPEKLLFRWYRFQSADNVESESVSSPIPWGPTDADIIARFGWLRLVTSTHGDVYIISSHKDGRLHVLKWEQKKLTLVAQCGTPLFYVGLL